MPFLRIRFLVPTEVIRDGTCPFVSVGERGTWRLNFSEEPVWGAPQRWGDLTVTLDVDAHLYPSTGPPRLGPRPVSPSYPTTVHGAGFTAFWSAPRPVRGPVRLRGMLHCDLLYGAAPVTGRVARLQLLTETFRRDGDGWPWVSATSRELTTVPHRFDDGLVRVPHPRFPGRFAAVRPDPFVADSGVLVDLDLAETGGAETVGAEISGDPL